MKKYIRDYIKLYGESKIYTRVWKHAAGSVLPDSVEYYCKNPLDYSRKILGKTEDEVKGKFYLIVTKQAEEKAKKQKDSDRNDQYTLRSLFREYLKYVVKVGRLSPRSAEAREQIWDLYLYDSDLADMDIRDITSEDLSLCMTQIIEKGPVKGGMFKEKYFKDIKGAIHGVYKYAIDIRHLPIIDLPKAVSFDMYGFAPALKKRDDIAANALTDEELKRLIAYCQKDTDDLPRLGLWLNCYLGLRFAELYALRWCDVDLKKMRIHICGHIDKTGARIPYTKKKTAEGMRYIPIIPQAEEVLDLIMAIKPENAGSDDPIFPGHGYYTYRRRCRDAFRNALELANDEKIPDHYVTHTIRATAATCWYSHGINIKVIQSLLGHTTVQMTLRYCHNLQSLDQTREEMVTAMAV